MGKKFYLNQKGSAFIMSLVFATVFSVIGVGTIKLIGYGDELHAMDEEVVKSYWTNDAVLRIASRYISRKNASGSTPPDIGDETTVQKVIFTCSSSEGNTINGFSLPAVYFNTFPNGEFKKYTYVCSTYIHDGNFANRSELSGVSITSLSKFTCFSENTLSGWWNRQVIDGNYHTNGRIRMGRSMADKVYVTGEMTTGDAYNLPGLDAPYDKGIELEDGTKNTDWVKTRLPDYDNKGTISTAAVGDMSAFPDRKRISAGTRSVRLELRGDKIYVSRGNVWDPTHHARNTFSNSTPVAGCGLQEILDVDSIMNHCSGIIEVDDTTWVKGTLDGRISIVTTTGHDIVLGDDIKYANMDLDPSSPTVSDDALGLISGKNIRIPYYSDYCEVAYRDTYTEEIYGQNLADNPYWHKKIQRYGIDVAATMFATNPGCGLYTEENAGWAIKDASILDPAEQYIRDFNFYGSLCEDTPGVTCWNKGWTTEGIQILAKKDLRFIEGSLRAPGIPVTKGSDSENSGAPMWELSSGNYTNKIVKVN